MPRRRAWPLTSSLSFMSLVSLLFIGFTILAVPLAAASSSSSSPSTSPSPPAEAEMICSPADPSDCYPKHFVPTDEFQVVREGQDIPSGLHVRMNVYTGQKEAKIYDPTEGDDPSLEGLPVEGAVVVVQPGADGEEDGSEEVMKVPKGAPRYEPVGKIKEPQEPGSLDDYSTFAASMEKLKKTMKTGWTGAVAHVAVEELEKGLENLEELAHDIYYGLKISEDADALKALFCLLTRPEEAEATEMERQAASIIAAATQNNPAALKQVVKRWSAITKLKCPGTKKQIGKVFYESLVMSSDPRTTKAKVAAMNGLVKDKGIKKELLSRGGMGKLLWVLLSREGKEWEATKTKIGHFVVDNFLDESMGAVLGVWPPALKKDRVLECDGVDRLEDGCWAHHMRKEAVKHVMDEGHWSQDVYFRLTGENAGVELSEGHVEL